MLNAISPLVESGIINEETRKAISEAWDSQLSEAKEQIRSQLREEFANRYEHDKTAMVAAVDKMVTESLTTELQEFQHDKQALAEDRVATKAKLLESAGKFDKFLIAKLTEEISELRKERKMQESATYKLDQFVKSQLAEEIADFHSDKKALVETKVKLVAEAKRKLAEVQQKFIARSSKLVKEMVTSSLSSEMSHLKEDIQAARENMFGRRLFEAFASEFAVTHLNEHREMAKLTSVIAEKEKAVMESQKQMSQLKESLATKDREIKKIKESADRSSKMGALLKTLNKEKATVMGDLLESVQTDKLQAAFDKYLPAVLGQGAVKRVEKMQLTESHVEVTGDKTAKTTTEDKVDNNVVELRRLAGLK
ncbi:hypothetical protein UFOVP116_424 [uncultured Caudovirales phage]|uniref:Uncharacterized protein n=1 Tax=uncultured Caudovirales phage TaxID=2100421 RepID=A0A6J5L7G0_9CAUD|nr:hypothetical protein UFOVP116_424 [uncultured Caudovirales phage]